jgi:hypothetical protein
MTRPRRRIQGVHPRPRTPRPPTLKQRPLAALWVVLPLVAGSATWLWSLAGLSLRDVGDVGLLPVLPAGYWAGLGLLLVGTSVAIWHSKLHEWLVATHVVALVVVLYGTTAAVWPYPRGTVPWRHVGIAAYIGATGQVDPRVDAYFNWPGFFALLASYSGMAGLDDAAALMRWAPVVNNLLFLLPMLIIARALTQDRRLAWSACVLFFLGNWVDQDYLAPQAMAFFLYLCVLALLLTLLRAPERLPRALVHLVPSTVRDRLHPTAPPAVEASLTAGAGGLGRAVVAVVLITTAVAAAHQLTPFALVLALLALAATGGTRVRGLPLVAGLITVAWLSFPAVTYLQGNVHDLLEQVGDLTGAAQGNLVERVQGSPGHLVVVRARLLFSAAIWGMAVVGAARVWRRGGHQVTAVALAAVPGLLFGLQTYGGEMVLRIFFLSLPFTCMLIVHALPTARTDRSRRTAGALFLVGTLALAPGFVLVRYGNQLIDQRSTAEVQAVRTLYRLAPAGAVLVAGNENTPWRNEEYADHRHLTITGLTGGEEDQEGDVSRLAEVLHTELTETSPTGLVLLTRQQREYEALLGRPEPWTLEEVETALRASPEFRVVFENDDAVILAPVGGAQP